MTDIDELVEAIESYLDAEDFESFEDYLDEVRDLFNPTVANLTEDTLRQTFIDQFTIP